MELAYISAAVKKLGDEVDEEALRIELNSSVGNGKTNVSTNDDSTLNVYFTDTEHNYNVDSGTVARVESDLIGLEGLTTAEIAKLPTGVTELDYNDIENKNLKDVDKIKAVITGDVPIPKNATYEEGSIDTGVVIQYKNSEFVWVPIPVTAANSLYAKGTTKPMARLTSGKDANGRDNYQGVLYTYNGTGTNSTSTERTSYGQSTTSYREPAYLTNSSSADASSYNTVGISSDSLQQAYNTMVESVSKYGGFFVGRYETSYNITTNKVESVADVNPATAYNTNTNSWYGLYQKQKEFTESTDKMAAEMIWGSQYDAMLNWALEGKDKSHVTTQTNSTHNKQYDDSTIRTKTTTETDKINNIYDLEGNLFEWTQEARYAQRRVSRGGDYNNNGSPSIRGDAYPNWSGRDYGSRLSLYIK